MSLDRPTRSIRLLSICISVDIFRVVVIWDWIVSKRFYMKSTDVSICPVTFIKIHLNGRKNENSFKEGAIFLDTHFNILCKKLYKQATLSDNRGETEF